MEKRILTDEVRQALISKTPFSRNATIEYTPPTFLEKDEDNKYLIPEEFRPIFTLRPFNKAEMDEIKRNVTSKKNVTDTDTFVRVAVRKVVINWRNLFDTGTMEEVEYKADPNGGVDKDLWDIIPLSVMSELLTYVSQVSGLLPTQRVGL